MSVRLCAAGVLAVLHLAGCRGDDAVRTVRGDLVADPGQLSFPLTWLGHPTVQTLHVHNASRATKRLSAEVTGNFALLGNLSEIAGGETVALRLRFDPDAEGAHPGVLVISSEGSQLEVRLRGDARVAPSCADSGPCMTSAFDPGSGTCVESPVPNGTTCGEGNACISEGKCSEGVCHGIERACDDGNACTQDACDPSLGCVFIDASASCTAPQDACKVAFCDPLTGCGLTDAPDGTSCGAGDCERADICLAGSCRNVPVPEGAKCGGSSPCQGEGICRNKVCIQPDPTVLASVWTYTAAAGARIDFRGVTDSAQNLYWTECTDTCLVLSATREGVERWRRPMVDDETASFASVRMTVGDIVVSTIGHAFVEARRASDGTHLWSRNLQAGFANVLLGDPAANGRGQVVFPLESDGSLLVALEASTGATAWTAPVRARQVEVCVDERGSVFASGLEFAQGWTSTGSPLWATYFSEGRFPATHGGVLTTAGHNALRTSDGSPLWAWGSSVISEGLLRGGSSWSLMWRPSAGELSLLRREAATGRLDWEYRYLDTAWVSDLMLTSDGSALMLVMNSPSIASSWRPWALEEVSPSGVRTYSCELPSPFLHFGGSVLLDGRLVTQGHVQDGSTLFAFDVPGRRLASTGWVTWRGTPQRTGAPR